MLFHLNFRMSIATEMNFLNEANRIHKYIIDCIKQYHFISCPVTSFKYGAHSLNISKPHQIIKPENWQQVMFWAVAALRLISTFCWCIYNWLLHSILVGFSNSLDLSIPPFSFSNTDSHRTL